MNPTQQDQPSCERSPAGRRLCSARRLALLAVACCGLACGIPPAAPVATDIDPAQATPEFWWDKPAQVRVPVSDFDRAFVAAEKSARDLFFVVDRSDAREGLITTRASTAAQWFEPWRQDNASWDSIVRSSVDTYRRTVRIQIEKVPDGGFIITPKVLVERQTLVGRRITGVVGFRGFTSIDQSSITADTDDGRAPASYWYAIGRDYELELQIGKSIVSNMY
jgi:hypothetical protein